MIPETGPVCSAPGIEAVQGNWDGSIAV
jgi:hypothetical protein